MHVWIVYILVFSETSDRNKSSNFQLKLINTKPVSRRTIPLIEQSFQNPTKTFGQNQILRDFGLHPDNFTNGLAVEEKIKQIEDKFNLVLLAER